MQHTLHEHIIRLEERIQELRNQLTVASRSRVELAPVQLELEAAELALAHYRAAYRLEQSSLSGPASSSTPATDAT